jgi:hypothetical protein
MKAAELKMSYARMIECGGDKLYEERHLRDWWGDGEELSLAAIVGAKLVPLSRVLWVCFHMPVVPYRALQLAAANAAVEYLRRAREAGIYVDLRSPFALEKKKAWIEGRVSLGELHHARHRARSAMHDISELCTDPRALVVAHALFQASSDNAETALRSFHYTIEHDPLAEKGALVRSCLARAVGQEEA